MPTTLKRTYALPAQTVESFEQHIAAGKRSAVVAEAIAHWMNEQRRAELRQAVIEGCADMADVYLEVEREYAPLDAEVARAQSQ